MKAIVQRAYGRDVLRLEELPPPRLRRDEALVRVRAASVHPDVWHVMTGLPYVLRLMGAGLSRPKNPIPGTDMAGVVEAVGEGVTRFRPGDAVFGETIGTSQWVNGGAFAELVAVKEENLARKPDQVSFEQAATVPTAGNIVLLNLRGDTAPRAGQRVLINGAGGGVGSIALQFAKSQGAHVTAIELPEKLELVRKLGADAVLDGSLAELPRELARAGSAVAAGKGWHLIVDIPCNHRFPAWRPLLTTTGIYVVIGHDHFGRTKRPILGLVPYALGLGLKAIFVKNLQKLTMSMPPKAGSMATLASLLESRQLTPIIDRTFPLEQTPEALRYLESGRARGRIVISM